MAGSDSSVHGRNHGDEEPPVARAELRQLGNSLLEAMERMFNERLPAAGGRGPQEEEFGDKNSRFGNGFHDHFGNGRGGRGGGRRADFDQYGGGRRADFYNQHGRGRRHDRHVHFDDKDEGFDDNENPSAHHGRFGQHHDRRRGAGYDEGHH